MAPDGNPAAMIECARSQADCLDEAQRVCPTGYAILDQGSQSGSVSRTNYNTYARTATTRTDPTYNGTMLIQCRVPTATCQRQGDLFFRDPQGSLHCVPTGEREQAVGAGWVEAGR